MVVILQNILLTYCFNDNLQVPKPDNHSKYNRYAFGENGTITHNLLLYRTILPLMFWLRNRRG